MRRILCVMALVWVAACARKYAYSTGGRGYVPRSALMKAELVGQPAVRHRMVKEEAIMVASPGMPVAKVLASPEVEEPEKLVVEVWMEIEVEDVGATAAAVRKRVESEGGRVVSENVYGEGRKADSAALEVRVKPGTHGAFIEWIAGLGEVESRRILASDVGRTIVDQELALKNLQITMTRLQAIAERGVTVTELLEIEREMTRVRGEIEKLTGEHRWLLDRVDYATVELKIQREGYQWRAQPVVNVRPGLRLASLYVVEPAYGPQWHVGGGGQVQVNGRYSVEVEVYQRSEMAGRIVVATVGAATYSRFLGGGRRRFFNLYLGARAGYGALGNMGGGVFAAEIGVELYRSHLVLVDTALRGFAFGNDRGIDSALQAALAVGVPFD